jgi:general secretion pathway protein G
MLLTTVRDARRSATATRRAAFTLLEVLIVVAILVILASAASIALFRYLEDAKVGRAKTDMRVIELAYKKYYAEKGTWPENIQQIAPQLEQDQAGLIDPWGGIYHVEIVGIQQSDGQSVERPIVKCQPPGNKPLIQWPEK